jgi:probable F420-dependent oxidoreductase
MKERLHARLGRIGLWTFLFGSGPAAAARETAVEAEELGYEALWYPEALGREGIALGALLLGWTTRAGVASGILNIWGRDPVAAVNGARTLDEAYPGRFVLGLGVSHQHVVTARGHRYERPLSTMRAYLDGMDEAPYMGPDVDDTPPRLLAALAPRMLELAAERAAGSLTYFVPPEHTAVARESLGADRFLAVEQAVVLETDATRAREIARDFAARYLAAENYRRNLVRLGFSESELDDPSDRLIDAIVVHGDEVAIAGRVQEHFAAGADHVAIQPLPNTQPQLDVLRRLAPALTSLARA